MKLPEAQFVSYVSSLAGRVLELDELSVLNAYASKAYAPVPAPVVGKVNLDPLFKALLDDGSANRIEAVKQHRALTGLGLKESLAAVDSIKNRLKSLDI